MKMGAPGILVAGSFDRSFLGRDIWFGGLGTEASCKHCGNRLGS